MFYNRNSWYLIPAIFAGEICLLLRNEQQLHELLIANSYFSYGFHIVMIIFNQLFFAVFGFAVYNGVKKKP